MEGGFPPSPGSRCNLEVERVERCGNGEPRSLLNFRQGGRKVGGEQRPAAKPSMPWYMSACRGLPMDDKGGRRPGGQ